MVLEKLIVNLFLNVYFEFEHIYVYIYNFVYWSCFNHVKEIYILLLLQEVIRNLTFFLNRKLFLKYHKIYFLFIVSKRIRCIFFIVINFFSFSLRYIYFFNYLKLTWVKCNKNCSEYNKYKNKRTFLIIDK